MIETLVKTLHILGAIVILGTGTGIAFFMLMAHRSGDAAFVARTARVVVLADAVFTASAALVQPATGLWLARFSGYPVLESWVGLSLILYVGAGISWLPVLWMQVRMRDLAAEAARKGEPLSADYRRLFHRWFAFGFPGFGFMLAILWLMVAKPDLAGAP